MGEDLTKRLPDQPNNSQELLRLIQSISTELADLKQTVNARLHDTRPIWEKFLTGVAQPQSDITQLKADVAQLQEGQRRLEDKLEVLRDETRTGLRNLKRQFGILNDTFLEVRADYKDLDKRVYQLEEPQP